MYKCGAMPLENTLASAAANLFKTVKAVKSSFMPGESARAMPSQPYAAQNILYPEMRCVPDQKQRRFQFVIQLPVWLAVPIYASKNHAMNNIVT
jgi:hypothetical protein